MRVVVQIAWLLLLPLVLTSTTRAQVPSERQVVLDAVEAIGGRDRILALKTLVIEGYGTNPNIGQAMTPESDPLLWMLPDYKRSLDLENRRMALEFTRRPAFPAVFDNARQHQRLDGDVAYNVPVAGRGGGPPGAAPAGPARLAAAVAQDRRLEMLHHPLTVLRAALEPSSRLSNLRRTGGRVSVDVATAAGDVATLTVDELKRPVSVRTAAYHPNLGDTGRTTTFGAYENLDGIRLPKRLITTLDRWVEYSVGVMKHTLDADLSALAAPEATRVAPPPAAPAQNVVANSIGPGIWFLTGGGIPSLVVEFAAHVAVVEAGTAERFAAVLAKAKELVPGKPITQLVLSHHHFDHTGGLREAVAQGMTIITHRVNEAWFREAVRRPHTLAPDTLSRAPRPFRIVSVDDFYTIKDAAMEMTLYHLVGSTHGDGILAAYFPAQRVYAEADVWNPGAQIQPHIRSLSEDIARRKLQIDRVVPLHGQQVQPFAELEKTRQEWSSKRVTTTTYVPPPPEPR